VSPLASGVRPRTQTCGSTTLNVQPGANVGIAWYYYLCFLQGFGDGIPAEALQAAAEHLDDEFVGQFEAST
jgi:hypothetical protein